jgi:thiaminase/transcriptional activator TenA
MSEGFATATRPSERLMLAAEPDWSALPRHPFVVALADGTLPAERFRFYLEQNVQYLPIYAQVLALGVAKARDAAEMASFAAAMHQITEVEIPANTALLSRVIELGAPPRGAGAEQFPATLTYTSFLLATAHAGGPPEIFAAVLPCTWSYGMIGRALAPQAVEHPVYHDWIGFFGTDEYEDVVETLRRDTDAALEGATDAQLARLAAIFRTSTRLEWGFWDMADRMLGWPASDATAS